MELWVRSQDKERLIKPIDFYIEETIDYVNRKSEFDIYALNFANADIRIGTYSTKERAFEVLDEMQNILDAYNRYNNNSGKYEELDLGIKVNMLSYVYQMPKE